LSFSYLLTDWSLLHPPLLPNAPTPFDFNAPTRFAVNAPRQLVLNAPTRFVLRREVKLELNFNEGLKPTG
jgi:hypothetical protein